MTLKKKPVNGMKDIMPREAEIRDYVINIIKNTYRSYGFVSIETPVMEDINNLLGSKGGENEKLIFKILKRGEKLNIKNAVTEDEVVDFGMRYDLTVPLCRYYSCYENELSSPFKALQIGNVYRADRPQRGRYRQFTQCDIDILGEASSLAEIELILATGACISNIGFKDFEIRINDRRILRAMAQSAGMDEDRLDEIFVILDKMDKLGVTGVEQILLESGFSETSVGRYMAYFKNKNTEDLMSNPLYAQAKGDIDSIICAVNDARDGEYNLVFDPGLVRGMGYYTGTIFEISMPKLGLSCGGGGRYDKLVGSFLGRDVPACGFSIGFERIILLLLEDNFEISAEACKRAYLVEKGYPNDKLSEIFVKANEERKKGIQILVTGMNKNKKFQKEQLKKEGYSEFLEFFIPRES